MASSLEDLVLGITQGFFGETVTYTQGSEEVEILAVFDMDWIESNGVSTFELTAKVKLSDLPASPTKSDTITRGASVYKVRISQPDGVGGLTLILGD